MTETRPGAILLLMRTPIKTAVLALAFVFTVSAGSLMAQVNWQPVAVQKVPVKVMTGYKKLFAHNKISKAEKSGTGPAVLYRFTIVRKGKTEFVVFDAKGRSQG